MSQTKKITARIAGMHCSSCEVLIERAFKKIPGIVDARVDHARAQAQITCTTVPTDEMLTAAIAEHGYRVTDMEEKGSYWQAGGALLLVYALYVLLRQFKLVPDLGVSEGMGYGFVFVLGLVAALSTCIAVTGGLLLAISARHAQRYPNATRWERFRPHLYFNLGRVGGYAALGAVVGALGSLITVSPGVMRFITVLASVAMVVLGLKLLRIFPWFTRWFNFGMPKFLAHRIAQAGEESAGNRASFLLGAATFFLPCGFTQALQLYVLSTGDAWKGALTLGIFSLGTLPALVGVGVLSSFMKGRVQRYFLKFSGALVVLLGIWNLFGAGGLGGVSAARPAAELLQSTNIGTAQIVDMVVDGYAYRPAQFTLKAGVPVTWRIDARRAAGCAQVISIPDLRVTQLLSRTGITTVTFTAPRPGVFPFSCSMGMAGPGQFVVTN